MKPTTTAASSIAIFAAACSLAAAQPATVHFDIDAQQDGHPISKFIYGINTAITDAFSGATVVRQGGNRMTAYNWTNNASNAGNDWHFQNDDFMVSSGEAAKHKNEPGGAVIPVLENTGDHHAATILTIPMCDYVAADTSPQGDVRYPDGDTSKPIDLKWLQKRFRPVEPMKRAPFMLTPDPNSPVVYADEFVNWVSQRFPYTQTDPDRPVWYCLDNEPDIWNGTHAEIHPGPLTYDELVDKSIAYATAIKKVSPYAKVFGHVSYGWHGFDTLQDAPDHELKGDFQVYFLKRLAEAEKAAGMRLVDTLDCHWYPEAQGKDSGGKMVRITPGDNSPGVVASRLQAPRSLWDPTYVEQSWIVQGPLQGQAIALLPRLQKKIDENYPGTKLTLTEYNYGGADHISGAIAEADVLGIFGKYGVDNANEWPMAGNEPYTAAGFEMFRNFDGKGSQFGDTSVHAATDNVADTSVYASTDSANPSRLVIVALNKTDHAITAQINVKNAKSISQGEAFQLTDAGPQAKAAGAVQASDPSNISYTLPPYSVSTIRLMAGH